MKQSTETNSHNSKSTRLWLAFIAVTLVAFFFRFYRLADHPLGLFFDPAINGLDAVRLMQRGGHVLFFPTNGGRESLFMYLLIPYIWLFGTTPFSIRALTATISLLNVVLLFGFLYQIHQFIPKPTNPLSFQSPTPILPKETRASSHQFQTPISNLQSLTSNYQYALWFAALGGLALATSYWHIVVSRLGQRPILVPLLSVAVFWFFLKGWTSGQKQWFVLSGLFLGLAGYTYPAARLLPLILVLAVLPEFISRFKKQSQRSQGESASDPGSPQVSIANHYTNFIALTLTALIVYLPMAWYLVTHPAQFSARAFSVMVWNFLDTSPEIIAELGRNTLRVAGFFCCSGSPNPIFGLPDYPGLSPWLTPLLLVGLFVALKNWRNLFHRLVGLWWLIGIVPSIIAIEAPHPLRMIVAVVPTAILVAVGAALIVNRLSIRFTYKRFRLMFQTLPFLLMLIPLPGLFRTYFIDWTRLQVTQGIYDYSAVAIRDEIVARTDENVPIYLPFARFNDSPLLFYLSGSFRREAALSALVRERALVISPEKNVDDTTWIRLHQQTATVLPPLTAEGQQLIQTAFDTNAVHAIQTAAGETAAGLVELSLDPTRFLQQPTQAVSASFGPVELTGVSYDWIIDPIAGEFPVTLYWQANDRMSQEYELILHLVDDRRQVWGDSSGRPLDWVYPTSFWRPDLDEIAVQRRVITGAERIPAGRYWLALSIFDPARGQRLPLTDGLSDSPDTFFIGPLKVPLPQPSAPLTGAIASQPAANFGEVATLAGFKAEHLSLTAGESLQFTLLWEAQTSPEVDYTVFVHLLDAQGDLVSGQDTQPVAGRYPTTIWSPGERIIDQHQLPIPESLPSGQYRLAIGLYHQPTGKRLPVYDADRRQNPHGRLILEQPVQVQ